MTHEEATHKVWCALESAAFLVRFIYETNQGETVDLAYIETQLREHAATVAAVRAAIGNELVKTSFEV